MFNITIVIDSENEGTESFDVIISSTNLHPNVSIGIGSKTTVSIVDDIGELRQCLYLCAINVNFFEALISFARSTYMINENIGTLQVEVTISEPFNVDITVHIVTGDILATGISYTVNITILCIYYSVSTSVRW